MEAAAKRRKGGRAPKAVKVASSQALDLDTDHPLLRRPKVAKTLPVLRDREDTTCRLSRCLSFCQLVC